MNIHIPDFSFETDSKHNNDHHWQSPQAQSKNPNKQIELELTNSPPHYPYPYQQTTDPFESTQFNNHTLFLNQLQKLYFQIETTSYSLAVEESELENLKLKQDEVQKMINKTERKLKEKSEKQLQVKRAHKLQNERKQKLKNGYRLLQKQLSEMKTQEVKTRNRRIQAQQAKNQIYSYYVQAQSVYRDLLEDLHDLDGIQENVKQMSQQNQYLKENIQRFNDVLFGEEREQYYQQRKNIREEIKYLNETVSELQNEELTLTHEIQGIQNAKKAWQIERAKIKEKTDYGSRLAKKIQQLKTELAEKRTEYTQIQSTYRQISIEQNKLKKQIILERECREQQKRYKEKRKKDMQSTGFGRQYTPRQQAIETRMSQENREQGSGSKKIKQEQMRKLHKLFERYQNVGKGI